MAQADEPITLPRTLDDEKEEDVKAAGSSSAPHDSGNTAGTGSTPGTATGGPSMGTGEGSTGGSSGGGNNR